MKALGVLIAVCISTARSQFYYQQPFPSSIRVERANPPPEPTPYKPEPYPSYPPASYAFDWKVLDSYTKNDYGHQESRKDAQTTGSYYVALPDGRVQRVSYSVDGYGGYQAEVTYEGEAAYPEAPAPGYPKPTYPKPSYPSPPAYPVQPYAAASKPEPKVVVKAEAKAAEVKKPEVKKAEPEPVQEAQPVVITTSLPPRTYPVTPAPPAHPSPTIRRYNYKTLVPAKAIATTEAPAPAEEKPGSYYFRFY